MIAGVAGQKYSYKFKWDKASFPDVNGLSSEYSDIPDDWDDAEELRLPDEWEHNDNLVVFCSEDVILCFCRNNKQMYSSSDSQIKWNRVVV